MRAFRFNGGICNFFLPHHIAMRKTTNKPSDCHVHTRQHLLNFNHDRLRFEERRHYWFYQRFETESQGDLAFTLNFTFLLFIFIPFPPISFKLSISKARYVCYRQFIQLQTINVGLFCMCGENKKTSRMRERLKNPNEIYHSLPTFEAPDYHFLSTASITDCSLFKNCFITSRFRFFGLKLLTV